MSIIEVICAITHPRTWVLFLSLFLISIFLMGGHVGFAVASLILGINPSLRFLAMAIAFFAFGHWVCGIICLLLIRVDLNIVATDGEVII